jgi:hypothetical protein
VNLFCLGHGHIIGSTESRGEKARYDIDEAGCTGLGAHAGNGVVGDLVAGATKTSADDAHRIARAEAAACEALGECEHVLVAEGGLELGKGAERQTEAKRLSVEDGIDLAAV